MKSSVLKFALAPAAMAAALLMPMSASNATPVAITPENFYINVLVNSTEAITNIVEFTDGPALTATGQFAIDAGITHIFNGFPFPQPASDYNVFLMGIVSSDDAHNGGLALFVSNSYALAHTGSSFDSLFPSASYNEHTLAFDLANETPAGDSRIDDFFFGNIDAIGFHPGDAVSIVSFTPGDITGSGVSRVLPTPLPAALPLFAGGLGVLGLIARRKRKQVAA